MHFYTYVSIAYYLLLLNTLNATTNSFSLSLVCRYAVCPKSNTQLAPNRQIRIGENRSDYRPYIKAYWMHRAQKCFSSSQRNHLINNPNISGIGTLFIIIFPATFSSIFSRSSMISVVISCVQYCI